MAGIHLSIDSSGLNKAQLWLAQIQNQMPFAASKALNEAAKVAAKDLNQSTNHFFDRPSKFTQNAYRVTKWSNKRDLTAELSPKPIQEKYLLPSIRGGIRPQRPSERKLALSPAWRPGRDAKRSKATGEITKAHALQALKGGPDWFMLKERKGKLGAGIYRRIGSGRQRRFKLEEVLRFNSLPNIPKRWPINRITKESVSRSWGPGLQRYVSEALRTAR